MTEPALVSMAGAGQTLAPQQQHGQKLLPVLVRVARKISDGSIVQVTSQCANEVSCVNNMKQNFNPGTIANNIYNKYVQQACKPFGASVIGARFKSNSERSTCFFCVEPCTTAEAASYASTANCIGPVSDGVADA